MAEGEVMAAPPPYGRVGGGACALSAFSTRLLRRTSQRPGAQELSRDAARPRASPCCSVPSSPSPLLQPSSAPAASVGRLKGWNCG